MTVLQQAFLLGLLGAYCWLELVCWFSLLQQTNCPLSSCGTYYGGPSNRSFARSCSRNLFLGTVVIGGYQAPDAGVSSILAAAFAIHSGMDTDAALLLAVPIAVIMTSLQNVLWAGFSFTSKMADRYAEKGSSRGVYGIMFLEMFLNTLL